MRREIICCLEARNEDVIVALKRQGVRLDRCKSNKVKEELLVFIAEKRKCRSCFEVYCLEVRLDGCGSIRDKNELV